MKILFIGDVVAKLGRQTVKSVLPNLRKKEKIDFVIANVENLAAGRGVTADTLEEMKECGVDFFTSGNHIFYQEDFESLLNDTSRRLIRPANYPEDVPGRGFSDLTIGTNKIRVINLSGITMIKGPVCDPFRKAEEIISANSSGKIITIIDFHAELNSEKQALGYYLDGKVAAVLGTHTHVGTIDVRILPQGSAYVSDVGMTGSLDSVLGVEKEIIIGSQMYPYPQRFNWVEKGPAIFNSVLLNIGANQKVKDIKRIDLKLP